MANQEMKAIEQAEITLSVQTFFGILDMRVKPYHVNLLNMAAYRVALYGPDALKDVDVDSHEKWHFLNPDDAYHGYFLYRVTQLRSELQAQIPGLQCLLKDAPHDIFEILSLADSAALAVAKFGPQHEEEFLAYTKQHDAGRNYCLYRFLKPEDKFRAYYEKRLREYRQHGLSPLRIPGREPSGPEFPTPRAAGTAKSYSATAWNGYTMLDECFRAELESNLRAKFKPRPKKLLLSRGKDMKEWKWNYGGVVLDEG